ncbi:MAG: hypothetical protein OXJ37_06550 [Bryobacterales bacterium]|nr:hypothetical protein [Bryobacterales bacterium]MDE0622938.1 hypothetical protein [Bryobacterales bacterium]
MADAPKPKPREVKLPHHSYQPSKAELEERWATDADFKEVVKACLKPVRIVYEKPPERKRG